jgi:hypothetical protein
MSFVVWRPGISKDGICTIRPVRGVGKSFQLFVGVSRSNGWPTDASCAMDPAFPKDIELADSLYGASLVVISGKARQFFEAEGVSRVEFLPLRILNHKGRTASDDYFIVNPLEVCDCIDEQQSKAERNPISPESIFRCDQLVIRDVAVPTECKTFRPERWRDLILVRREIAERAKVQLSGLNFIEPARYTGLI